MTLFKIHVVEVPLTGTNDGQRTWRAKLKSDGSDHVALLFLFGDKERPTHVGEIARSELLAMLGVDDPTV